MCEEDIFQISLYDSKGDGLQNICYVKEVLGHNGAIDLHCSRLWWFQALKCIQNFSSILIKELIINSPRLLAPVLSFYLS